MIAIEKRDAERSLAAIKCAVTTSLDRIRVHPFISKATRGELTKEESLRWIYCAGRESRTFPKILENMLVSCDDPTIRGVLEDNLNDEYGNGNLDHAHYQHYVHLLDRLGVGRGAFEEYQERAGMRLAFDLAISVSRGDNMPRAIGYMLVNEGMTSITYSAVKQSVLMHFPGTKTPFFDLHIDVDEEHVRELYRAVKALPSTALEHLLYGVAIGERGMAVLLDEVIGVFDIDS